MDQKYGVKIFDQKYDFKVIFEFLNANKIFRKSILINEMKSWINSNICVEHVS